MNVYFNKMRVITTVALWGLAICPSLPRLRLRFLVVHFRLGTQHHRATSAANISFLLVCSHSSVPIYNSRRMSRGPIRSGLTLIAILSVLIPSNSSKTTPNLPPVLCEEARLRCAYRTGCGSALQHYLVGCAPGLSGKNCSETCQHALIALTSTDEGKDLMRCECDDDLCLQSKQRVEICRSSVTTTMNKTRVSCRIATWICNADALCQTALAYYNRFCKSMFQGRKCTRRCRNSLNILTRQEKAAKLTTCQCDGHEDYDCRAIQKNMNHLCYGKLHHGYRDITMVDDGSEGWSENDESNKKKTSSKENSGIALSLDKRIVILFLGVYLVLKTDKWMESC